MKTIQKRTKGAVAAALVSGFLAAASAQAGYGNNTYSCDFFTLGQRVDVPELMPKKLDIKMSAGPRGLDIVEVELEDGTLISNLVKFKYRRGESTRCVASQSYELLDAKSSTLGGTFSVTIYESFTAYGCSRTNPGLSATVFLTLTAADGKTLRTNCMASVQEHD